MIDENQVIFKNQSIERMIHGHVETLRLLNEKGHDAFLGTWGELSTQEQGESILAGYWFSLLSDAMMNRLPQSLWVDFSYETIHNLPACLTSLYCLQQTSYTAEKNADLVGRTIAAVLFGLAINEHNCSLRVKKKKEEPCWGADLSFKVGVKREIDFLEAAQTAIKSSPISVENGIFVEMTAPIKAYKSAIGVDLSKYKLSSFIINGLADMHTPNP